MSVQPGLEATISRTVSEDDTASALGSGDVAVLGTPAVVAICEEAAVKAVAGELEDGKTTVGTRVELEHLAPTLLGSGVVATARLDSVDGRRLEFAIEASDSAGRIATGRHSRVIVDRERFQQGARERT